MPVAYGEGRLLPSEGQFRTAMNSEPVAGLTHDFYRYPARFSPVFAREMIQAFTEPQDWVLDPFSGGFTTMVEAAVSARHCIGTDISNLAVFLGKAKTTHYSDNSLIGVQSWATDLVQRLKIGKQTKIADLPEQANLNSRETWAIRNLITQGLEAIQNLADGEQKQLARCIWLRTGQWALDSRRTLPSVDQLRQMFLQNASLTVQGASDFGKALNAAQHFYQLPSTERIAVQQSAIGIDLAISKLLPRPPKLILTSPPYPGVHVLYHRWQIRGRRETPAPFWISGTKDGHGASFYTLGARDQKEQSTYYENALLSFQSLANLCDRDTMVVQLIAFAEPKTQLPRYLGMMKDAGFMEISDHAGDGNQFRYWRDVPRRKWFATLNGKTGGSREVILIHRLQPKS